MQLDYFLLDVFTDQQLSGNQLAVVIKADDLSDSLMQNIAQEFNLSETIFLSQPLIAKHTARARIFTPTEELPFAGHPTIGASILLGLQQRASAVRLEEPIGLITCVMDRIDQRTGQAHFKLPQNPLETGTAPANTEIAETLGLSESDIGCGEMQPGRFSAGRDFIVVPVTNADVLAKIELEKRGWADVYGDHHRSVYVFTLTPDEQDNDLAARLFQPGLMLSEDPATGSAAAALIGLLDKYSKERNGQRSYRLRQGREMGRPSIIDMQVGVTDGTLVHCGIGGRAVLVAKGQLDLA